MFLWSADRFTIAFGPHLCGFTSCRVKKHFLKANGNETCGWCNVSFLLVITHLGRVDRRTDMKIHKSVTRYPTSLCHVGKINKTNNKYKRRKQLIKDEGTPTRMELQAYESCGWVVKKQQVKQVEHSERGNDHDSAKQHVQESRAERYTFYILCIWHWASRAVPRPTSAPASFPLSSWDRRSYKNASLGLIYVRSKWNEL